MKRKWFILIFVLCFSLCALCACRKDIDNDEESDSTNNQTVAKESVVIKMFTDNAKRDTDGTYRFRKYESVGNVSFSYSFSYAPSKKMYNCNILVTTNSGIGAKLYDYAAITFSWGRFKSGLFYAYHELDSIARIEFEYKKLDFKNNSLGNSYSYNVLSNSFANMDNASKKEYASRAFECLQQSFSYLKTTLANNGISTKLW